MRTRSICLECGRKMKTLKRHLWARHGLKPEQYREKWGLPADYPMVAANYSEKRTQLAVKNKFGHNRSIKSVRSENHQSETELAL